ncbi:MAG: hypothetical protein JST74_09315 [Bacteroidetes bacterium]|nr:hypothetical protein [Bacteroidota bacterium]
MRRVKNLLNLLLCGFFIVLSLGVGAQTCYTFPTVASTSGCAGYSYTLYATTNGGSVTSHNWWTAQTGGTSVGVSISNPGAGIVQSSLTAAFNSSVTYWVEAVCSGGVNPSRTPISFTVVAPTTVSYTASIDPMSVLPSNNLTLTASGASNLQWIYTSSSSKPTVASGTAPFVPTLGGGYQLTGTNSCGVNQTLSLYVNHLPISDAGLSRTVGLPLATYTVYGSGYDVDDGDAVTYLWTQSGTAQTLNNTTGLALQVVNPQPGATTFTLTVTDSKLKSFTSQVTITFSNITNNYNYVQQDNVLDTLKVAANVAAIPIGKKKTRLISYADDLGRPIEKVSQQASPFGNDMIGFKIFDGLGREANQYLPYSLTSGNVGAFVPTATALTSESSFYNVSNDKIADDAVPYSTTTFEPSPLSRPVKQAGPGANWASIGKSVAYGTNAPSDVLNWAVNGSGLPQAISPYFYSASILTKTAATDEQSVVTETYADIRGIKLLVRSDATNLRAETYYVYDAKGNLKFILPPELIKVLKNQSSPAYSPTQAQLDRWAYQYNYDYLNRAVESKAPGAGWVYTVYDTRDRVVLTQDANQRLTGDPNQSTLGNKWSYTQYDDQNRPVVSGVYGPDNTYTTRAAMQTYINSLGSGQGYQNVTSVVTVADVVLSAYASINEYTVTHSVSLEPGFDFKAGVTSTSFHTAIQSGGTPSTVFPTTNVEQLVKTYYDSYSCEVCSNTNFQYVSGEAWKNTPPYSTTPDETFPSALYTRLKGATVASSVKILGTTTWLNTVSYYNRYGSVVQVIGANHVGGRDRISTLYDFSGKKLEELQTAIGYNTGNITTQRKVFSYDPVGRLLQVQHQVNSQPMVILSALEYNELGQVVKKKLHSTDGGTAYLQNVDFRYDIRGELTNINNIPTGTDTGDDANDYFGMDLTYNTSLSGAGNSPRPDGLISAIRWKQDLGSKKRLYNFGYDNLKRVTSSSGKMSLDNSLTWTGEPDFFTENNLTYDLNGNILTLNRNTEYFSNGSNSLSTMDQLTYTYGVTAGSTAYSTSSDNGNQLQYVADNSTTATRQLGFADGGPNTIANPDYTYDANGNLTSDLNKKISKITYYFNNRPKKISINVVGTDTSYIKYTYDAAGIKLNQMAYIYDTAKHSPTYQTYVTTSTDYVGNFVLLNGQVLTVNQPEGRITPPTYENIFSNPDAGSLSGFTATSGNVTLSCVYQNTQTYVTASNSAGTQNEGIFPISTDKGTAYPVTAGQTYSFRILGYQTSGSLAMLYVKTNLGDLVWPGAAYAPVPLPTGAANESWASVSFVVPSNATSVSLGVKWNGPATGNTIYVNRVALYKTDFEYNYFITDQVGSTRVVLQTNPGTQAYTATMEPNNRPTEDAATLTNGVTGQFLNMNYAMIFSNPTANTTPGGSYVVKMNPTYKVGPAKSLKVYPGDVVNASVNSSYLTGGSYTKTPLATVMGAVAPVFGGVSGTGDPGAIFSSLNNTGNAVIAGLSPGQGTTAPSAFLNYILFDKDYNPLGGQSVPVPTGGGGPMALPQITAPEIGYVFIYLSYDNDTGNDVYFDDLKITQQESPVIQVNNYYPFGMKSYSWLRNGETDNAYLFQGKELIAQTGWYDFGSRMYYADLGRWFAGDPQKQFSSPYMAMGNVPMMGTDPNGEWFGWDDIIVSAVGFVVGYASYGLTKGNWGWKAAESGLVGAAIAEVGYLTLGGGLAAEGATASTGGLGAIKSAAQFAILDATTTATNVAENADNISRMNGEGAFEAIAGFEGISAIQSGFQGDWMEG